MFHYCKHPHHYILCCEGRQDMLWSPLCRMQRLVRLAYHTETAVLTRSISSLRTLARLLFLATCTLQDQVETQDREGESHTFELGTASTIRLKGAGTNGLPILYFPRWANLTPCEDFFSCKASRRTMFAGRTFPR